MAVKREVKLPRSKFATKTPSVEVQAPSIGDITGGGAEDLVEARLAGAYERGRRLEARRAPSEESSKPPRDRGNRYRLKPPSRSRTLTSDFPAGSTPRLEPGIERPSTWPEAREHQKAAGHGQVLVEMHRLLRRHMKEEGGEQAEAGKRDSRPAGEKSSGDKQSAANSVRITSGSSRPETSCASMYEIVPE